VSDEREEVAAALRRVREEVQRRALPDERKEALPAPGARGPDRTPPEPEPPEEPMPSPPDAAAVNAAWEAGVAPPPGLYGLLFRLFDRVLRPRFEAQRAFDARQVQLDNETLTYLGERLAATHRHYDRILGLYGQRLSEIDERHMILQKELVAHVQELVYRIDLVLAEGDRGRLALEFALEDVRTRLARLEEALRRQG